MKGDYFGSAYWMASFRCSKWQPDRDRRERLAKMPDEKGVEWGAGASHGRGVRSLPLQKGLLPG